MRRFAPAAVAFAGMVATALAPRAGGVRRGAAAVVVGGLAATTFDRLRIRHGSTRAGAAAVAVTTLGWATERVGSASGLPFGRYSYTGRLRPAIGRVPVLVPLAWFAMAGPSREAAHAALGGRTSAGRRVAVGAVALTAWDLFLDPQMVGEGYWSWVRPGRYRGIPLSNFAGWIVTSAAAMALLELTVPIGPGPGGGHAADGLADATAPDAGLVAAYAAVATMETLGFAAFFRDRLVATVGGVAMLPLALVATVRSAGRGRLTEMSTESLTEILTETVNQLFGGVRTPGRGR